MNGKIEGGRYYLWGPYNGTKTFPKVSHAVFTFSRWHPYSLFILWPYFFIAAAIFAFISGGIFGNKNAICNRMLHDEPATGCTAFP